MRKVLLTILFSIPLWLFAQTNINMQTGSFTTCSGYLYDSGGPGATGNQYANNENYTLTICPSTNNYVTLNFITWDLGAGDVLTVYNGNNTSAPVIGVYDNTSLPTTVASSATGNASGCMTLVFTSDTGGVGLGWAAQISCFAPCQTFSVEIDSLSHDTTGGFIDMCQGDTLRIWAKGNYGQNNTWYNQNDNNVAFNWYIGRSLDSVMNQNVLVYPFDTAWGTRILVKAKDSMGCDNVNPFELIARVSTTPNMSNVGMLHDTICFGETNTISLAAQTTCWSNTDSGFIAGTLALPDGSSSNPGVYPSTLSFSMFTPGDTVDALTDIIRVWVNMEHSYIGDLSLTLGCPNGNSVVLKSFPGGAGNWLGQPCDGSLNVPGNGWLYQWPVNTTPANGTLVASTAVATTDFCIPTNNGNTKPASTFTPVTPFTNLIGCPLNGTWTLTVVDQYAIDDGTLFGWGLNFDSTLYPSTTISYCPGIDSIMVDMDTNIVSTISHIGDTMVIKPHVYDTMLNVNVTVLDSFGCNYDTTYQFYVRAPNDPICCKAIPPVTSVVKVGCPGGSDGQIIADPVDSLGPPPFWYTWKNAAGTVIQQTDSVFNNDTLNNLPVGTYSVDIKDSIGCIVTKTINVGQVVPMNITVHSIQQTSCAGNYCDGKASATVVNGTSPYTYLWSGSGTGVNTNTLCSGQNFVQVTDNRGCIDTAFFNVGQPDTIKADALGDTLICISNPQTLTAVGTGGTQPYKYTWQGGASTQKNYTVTPSITTTYKVVISDTNNCPPDSAFVTVRVRPELNSQVFDVDTICPYDTTTLTVVAYGGDSIYSFAWSHGATDSVTRVSPDVTTYYYVTITDACGTQPSKVDSIKVQVGGYPKLRVGVTDNDTVCKGEPYTLFAKGIGGDGRYSYEWDNGLGKGQLKAVVPNKTSIYKVTVTDDCNTPAGEAQVKVTVGNFENFSILVDTNKNCDPATFRFAVDTVLKGATYEWDFQEGGIQKIYPSDTFDIQLTTDGCHDVTVKLTTELGCLSTKHYPCMVEVLPKPNADFDFDPLYPNVEERTVNFSGATFDGEKWLWTINGDTVAQKRYFYHHFPDSGNYKVFLQVYNEYNCVDTVEKPLYVYFTPTVFVPTAFTPNGDNKNETFGIIGEGISDEEFKMEIYNRWGNIVFETTDKDEHWNGLWNNSGDPAENGAYIYVIYYKLYNGLEQVKRGHINILR